ncbi:ribonuclease catalytic domain-containing protein [Desulfovibrio litoralis]|uniref:Exoribonuclease-2 n=1 Tax=Desulfovibrio litoralis DSM 11393 TaxID=1121455 RepID=A0A1M7RWX2_9BACT|nr:ribonuclease catalytic domain-containing protein [Desulfovibrio litoralis]SHN50532.1 exoribonuclease-2 [Desulfovibrio litoralis DSM 11393]
MNDNLTPKPLKINTVVEFLQDNIPQQAWVLEIEENKVRLLALNSREINMPLGRVLPWGRVEYSAQKSKEDIFALLRLHQKRRQSLTQGINPLLLWELSHAEEKIASAEWFAELAFDKIAENWLADGVAAVGQVLLQCKTHFKFNPPVFELYSNEQVEARLAKENTEKLQASLVERGQNFFKALWEVHLRNRSLSDVLKQFTLEPEIVKVLFELLQEAVASPLKKEQNELWRKLTKSLGDGQHLPLQLAQAWGLLPSHYNFWFDRAGYDPNFEWNKNFSAELEQVKEKIDFFSKQEALFSAEQIACLQEDNTQSENSPWSKLVSIDSQSTLDIDDAFYLEENEVGFKIYFALACPALFFDVATQIENFHGNQLSLINQIFFRASSVYLPEGSFHMLPIELATDLLSLVAEQKRPALLVELCLNNNCEVLSCKPTFGLIKVAARLSFEEVETVLNQATKEQGSMPESKLVDKTLLNRFEMLHRVNNLASKLNAKRIFNGAVIIQKPETEIKITTEDGEAVTNFYFNSLRVEELEALKSSKTWAALDKVKVSVGLAVENPLAFDLVGELMILVNSALAKWAKENELPLFYRTQDVQVPDEYAGVWKEPADIARIVKGLSGAQLELSPKRHIGIGTEAYATFSSPLRRYVDLINEYQLIAKLCSLDPALSEHLSSLNLKPKLLSLEELKKISSSLVSHTDATMQLQRFRTRYLKLLALKQANEVNNEDCWQPATITDIRDYFVFVSLDTAQIIVRGKRSSFDSQIVLGQNVLVRLTRINPLANEINIAEVRLINFN